MLTGDTDYNCNIKVSVSTCLADHMGSISGMHIHTHTHTHTQIHNLPDKLRNLKKPGVAAGSLGLISKAMWIVDCQESIISWWQLNQLIARYYSDYIVRDHFLPVSSL